MNGFDCYKMYSALRLHFTNAKYDYFQYNGKTQASQNSYLTHKNRYTFEKLANKYNEEIPEFFLSNMVENPKIWIYEMVSSESNDIFVDWKKRTQSMTYVFESDVDSLFRICNINKLVEIKNSTNPILLTKTLRKEVSLETLIIINDCLNVFKLWDKEITNSIIWDDFRQKCLKYSPFLQADVKKYTSILKKKAKEFS